jgi:sugar phosphate isomerase/epimerase
MTSFDRTGWSRRQVLAGAVMTGAAVAMPAMAAPFFGKGGQRPGVQLYPLSDAVAKDMDETFARLAAMGYRAVETSGFHGKRPVDLKAAADRAGLAIVSAHVQPQLRLAATDRLLTDSDLGPLVTDLHALGVRQVVMPLMLLPQGAVPAMDQHVFAGLIRAVSAFTVADWQRTAAFLNQRGEVLRGEGLALSYHNHNMEFAPIEGTTGWDVLMHETDPALVGFELDVGWAAAAGLDPVKILRAHPGRVRMLHVKDVDPVTKPNFVAHQVSAPVGKGVVNWPALLHLARAQGVSGYFVEQEPPFATNAFDAMAQSIAYLRRVK